MAKTAFKAPSIHGALVRWPNLDASIDVYVNNPAPIVEAGSKHEFRAVAYAHFENTGAAIAAVAKISFVRDGTKLVSSPETAVQIPAGSSDMTPLEFLYTYEFKPGSNDIKTEIAVWDGQSGLSLGSAWKYSNSYAA